MKRSGAGSPGRDIKRRRGDSSAIDEGEGSLLVQYFALQIACANPSNHPTCYEDMRKDYEELAPIVAQWSRFFVKFEDVFGIKYQLSCTDPHTASHISIWISLAHLIHRQKHTPSLRPPSMPIAQALALRSGLVESYKPSLLDELIKEPILLTSIFRAAIHKAMVENKWGMPILWNRSIHTLLFDPPSSLLVQIGQQDVSRLNSLVAVMGLVSVASIPSPRMCYAMYSCPACEALIPRYAHVDTIKPPPQCSNNKCRNRSFVIQRPSIRLTSTQSLLLSPFSTSWKTEIVSDQSINSEGLWEQDDSKVQASVRSGNRAAMELDIAGRLPALLPESQLLRNALGKRVQVIGVLKSRARVERDTVQEFFLEVISILEDMDGDSSRLLPVPLAILEKKASMLGSSVLPTLPWSKASDSFSVPHCKQILAILDHQEVQSSKNRSSQISSGQSNASLDHLADLWSLYGQAFFEILTLSLPSKDIILNAFVLFTLLSGAAVRKGVLSSATRDVGGFHAETSDSHSDRREGCNEGGQGKGISPPELRVLWLADVSPKRQAIMEAFASYAPNGVHVTCIDSSHQKLLASMNRIRIFRDTPEETVSAGPLVLMNRSTCFLDDFDRLKKTSAIYIMNAFAHREWLLQRKVYVRGGTNDEFYHDVMRVPVEGNVFVASGAAKKQFDPSRPLSTQLTISPNLLSAFDAILTRDPNGEDDCIIDFQRNKETQMGYERERPKIPSCSSACIPSVQRKKFANISQRMRHISSFMHENEIPLPKMEDFHRIVRYARKFCVHPTLSSDAADRIAEYYLTLKSQPRVASIDISLHTLISLKTLCTARAKADLSNTVRLLHVEDVIELFDEHSILGYNQRAIHSVAESLTSRTGKRTSGKGLGALLPGFERSLRNKMSSSGGVIDTKSVSNLAEQIIQMKGATMSYHDLVNAANEHGIILRDPNGWRLGI